jgi:hypothetical protein
MEEMKPLLSYSYYRGPLSPRALYLWFQSS